jgi:hypothetical protein
MVGALLANEKTAVNGSADEDAVVGEVVSLEASGAGATTADGAAETGNAAEGVDADAAEAADALEAAHVNDAGGANECATATAVPCTTVEASPEEALNSYEADVGNDTVGALAARDSVWLTGPGEAEAGATKPDDARNAIGTAETTAGSAVA